MNVREIEIFRAVMREGSVSRAAQKLLISQPAASKYIAQLERRVGVALFIRRGGRLLPTPEGSALYGQVDRLFSGLTQLENFIKDLGSEKQGHLTVATLPLLSLTVMPEVVSRFMAERPNLSVALQTRSSSRIVEWVAARQVDMGVCFCVANHPGVVAEPLVSLQLYCAIPPGDPLEQYDSIGIEQLAGRDLIIYDNLDHTRFWLESMLEQHNVYARRRIQVFWTSVAMELVMRGAGIALVDRLTAERIPGGVQQLRPLQPSACFDLSLVWPEHWPSSVVALSFAQSLRDYLREHLGEHWRLPPG